MAELTYEEELELARARAKAAAAAVPQESPHVGMGDVHAEEDRADADSAARAAAAADAEAADAAFRKRVMQQDSDWRPVATPYAERLKDIAPAFGRGLYQGTLANFGDELAGLVGGDAEKEKLRELNQKSQEEEPIAYGVGNLLGAVRSPVTRMTGGGQTALPRIVGGTVAGGVFGAGAGEGDPYQQLASTLFGAGTGLGLTALGEGVGFVAKKGYNALRNSELMQKAKMLGLHFPGSAADDAAAVATQDAGDEAIQRIADHYDTSQGKYEIDALLQKYPSIPELLRGEVGGEYAAANPEFRALLADLETAAETKNIIFPQQLFQGMSSSGLGKTTAAATGQRGREAAMKKSAEYLEQLRLPKEGGGDEGFFSGVSTPRGPKFWLQRAEDAADAANSQRNSAVRQIQRLNQGAEEYARLAETPEGWRTADFSDLPFGANDIPAEELSEASMRAAQKANALWPEASKLANQAGAAQNAVSKLRPAVENSRGALDAAINAMREGKGLVSGATIFLTEGGRATPNSALRQAAAMNLGAGAELLKRGGPAAQKMMSMSVTPAVEPAWKKLQSMMSATSPQDNFSRGTGGVPKPVMPPDDEDSLDGGVK